MVIKKSSCETNFLSLEPISGKGLFSEYHIPTTIKLVTTVAY